MYVCNVCIYLFTDSGIVSQSDLDDSVQDLEISGQSRDDRDEPDKQGTKPDATRNDGVDAPAAEVAETEELGQSNDDFSLTLSDDTAVHGDEVQNDRQVQKRAEYDGLGDQGDQGGVAVAPPLFSDPSGPRDTGRKQLETGGGRGRGGGGGGGAGAGGGEEAAFKPSSSRAPKPGYSGFDRGGEGAGSSGSGNVGGGGESSSEGWGSHPSTRPSSRFTDVGGSRPSSRLTDAPLDEEGMAGGVDMESTGRASHLRPPLAAAFSRGGIPSSGSSPSPVGTVHTQNVSYHILKITRELTVENAMQGCDGCGLKCILLLLRAYKRRSSSPPHGGNGAGNGSGSGVERA